MKRLRSSFSPTLPAADGRVKLGHPVPESNLSADSKRACPQQTHA